MEVTCNRCGQKISIEGNQTQICHNCQAEIFYTNETSDTIISDNPRTEIQNILPKKLGRYEIIEEIGKGGMGLVYKGYDSKLKRTVALKILIHLEETALKRFFVEAQVMATLDHPNIIRVYDVGEENNFPFIVMDFIEGQSLKEFLQKSTMKKNDAVSFILKVLAAIDYAHERGIIHRDLKPANIMLRENDDPVVMDFGLVKLQQATEKLSQTGAIMGTILYMAPEQASGEGNVDKRADIYAIACIMYEVLSGKPPFKGDTTLHLIKQILYEKPVTMVKYNKSIPGVLQNICMKALAKKKEERYQSCREFARDLQKFLNKEKVVVSTSSKSLPIKKIVKIAICVLLLITGIWFLGSGKAQESWRSINNKLITSSPEEWPQELWEKSWNGDWVDFTTPEWQQFSYKDHMRYAKIYQIWYAKQHGWEIEKTVTQEEVDFVFMLIPPGKFWMGTFETEKGRNEDETRHKVLITKPFWIGKYEVTQGQWRNIMKKFSNYDGDNHPIHSISGKECQDFCEKLGFQLPTEAQWEYACRAGTMTPFNIGGDIDAKHVNYNGNSPYMGNKLQKYRWATVEVGSLENANSWGCYDMHGNLQELCADDYKEFTNEERIDPTVRDPLKIKVIRGGCRFIGAAYCRSSVRVQIELDYAGTNMGFRVILPIEKN